MAAARRSCKCRPSSTNGPPSPLARRRVPALDDNYVWLIVDKPSNTAAVIDPAEAAPVEAALVAAGSPTLALILNTHHHDDHVGANLQLKAAHPSLRIAGPKNDAARIPGMDDGLCDGDVYRVLGHAATVLDVPGHTTGHCAWHFPTANALFCGDALFTLGCGRMFEGTPEQFYGSLCKLSALPDATRVYCAHEYTQSNARFAMAVEGEANAALRERCAQVDAARAAGEATVPGTVGGERATNPFLRTDSPAVRAAVGLGEGASGVEVFAALRKKKDNF